MQQAPPVLHMFCGKIASGKSTLSLQLAEAKFTVLISEDAWLSALFSDQMAGGSDYLRCAGKLQTIMEQHVISMLEAGMSVVLDFPANTLAQRAWMRRVIEATGVAHELHFLDVPDDVCLSRLLERNQGGQHAFQPTQAQFIEFSKYFAKPTQEEGFVIVTHR